MPSANAGWDAANSGRAVATISTGPCERVAISRTISRSWSSAQWRSSNRRIDGPRAASAVTNLGHARAIWSPTSSGSSALQGTSGERQPGGGGEGGGGDPHGVVGGPGVGHRRADPRVQPAGRVLGRVVERDPERRSQHLAERPVGDAAAGGQAAASVDRGGRIPEGGALRELLEEPALPDPGGPEHEDRPDVTGRGGVGERVQQRLQFAVPTDHRRREPGRGAHALHAGLASEDPVPLDDPCLPLELERDRGIEPEGAMRRGEGAFAHEDRPRLRDLLEARRDVDGVAGDDALVGPRLPAGVITSPVFTPMWICSRDPVLPFEFGVQLLEPLEHLERGADGALRRRPRARPGRRTPRAPRRRCTSRSCRPTNPPPRPSR